MVRKFLIFAIAGMLTCSSSTISINTNAENIIESQEDENIAVHSIDEHNLSIYSSGYKTLCIDALTRSNTEAQSIGLKNLTVEHSSNGRDGWSPEKNLGDMLTSGTNNYRLEDYSVSVNGGYFYRVTCTHYAKEKGLFGSSQSEYNVSNIIWIGN